MAEQKNEIQNDGANHAAKSEAASARGKLKIALVIDIFNDTGNGTSMSARHFVEQLRKRGHEVVILSQGEKDDEKENIVAFRTQNIPFFQKMCEEQHAVLAHPDDERIKKALQGVDIVHIYLPFWLGTHCARIAAEMNIPVLSCMHLSAENITYNAKLSEVPFATDLTYETLRTLHYKREWVSDLHCPSRMIAQKSLGHFFAQNIHIISNGYDPRFKMIPAEKTEEYKDKFVIVSVGRHTKEKAQDIIIKAVALSAHKNDIALVLAGSGPLTEEYKELAQSLGVDLRIKFFTQDELIRLLNFSDLFIQASFVETESISCLEAIATGLVPVISDGKMCATKQFALDIRSIFKQGKPKDLRMRIDYWFEHPREKDLMKEKYAQSALNYSLKKSIDSIEEVYDRMHTGRGNRIYMLRDYNNPIKIELPLKGESPTLVQIKKMKRAFGKIYSRKLKTVKYEQKNR